MTVYSILKGFFNSTPPTLSSGQEGFAQLDSAGNLKVNVAAGSAGGGASTTDESAFTPGSTAGTIAMGVYEVTPDTLTTGEAAAVLLDANRRQNMTLGTDITGEDHTNNLLGILPKPVVSSTYSPSVYAPMTQVTNANIKSSPGNVFSFLISNANSAIRYFQLHNTASAPSAGATPLYSIPIGGGTAGSPTLLSLDKAFFSEAGVNFSTGISWAISTTYATFTNSATATDHIAVVHYI